MLRPNRKKRVWGFVLVLSALMLSACYNDGSSEGDKDIIRVFAASSMTNAMQDMKVGFETEYPNKDIQLNFAGSKTLRSQIENGAQADIFISANGSHYEALNQLNMIHEGRALLENKLVLIVYSGSEVNIESLDDLTQSCQIVLAQEGVPAGNYAREILKKYGESNSADYQERVLLNLVSEESNVRQVLMKVAMGEADAALVYKTDVTENVKDSLRVIDIPKMYNVTGTYYMGILKGADDGARVLYDYVLSERGDEILESYGFAPIKE